MDSGVDYRRQAEWWEVMARVAEAVAARRDFGEILAVCDKTIAPLVQFDAIGLFELRGGEGRVIAALVDGQPLATRGLGLGGLERVIDELTQRRTISVADLRERFPAEHVLSQSEMRSLLLVPLTSGGELVGVLGAARRKLSPFAPADGELMERVGVHMAHAISNGRAHLRSQELASLKERLSLLLVHDLKNPLSIVKVNLDLLAEDGGFGPEERREILDEAINATDRLLTMIVDLIEISRAEENGLQLQLVEADLAQLLSAVVMRHRALARVRSVSLDLDVPSSLLARFDAPYFQRVLENILGNALRYAATGGRVHVGAVELADRVVISLENDGPHIPPALQSRLFEKYGAVDSSSGQRLGNRGLGLYLCRLVVEGHGGAIGVRNLDGTGVRFEITLPRGKEGAWKRP
jgi:signal transduction histidine kinase